MLVARDFVFYRYEPTLVGAILFAVLFGITTLLHSYQAWKTRSFYFTPFIIGGIFEVVGYLGRTISHFSPLALTPFIMQSLLLLVAPTLFAASIYMILGRLIRYLDAEHLAIIRTQWITKIFVCGDSLSLLLQFGGGGLMAAGSLNLINIGQYTIVVGLFVQLIFFGIFLIVSIFFFRRISSQPTQRSLRPEIHWRRLLHALFASSVLILIRSVFRVIEYLGGNDGYIQRHEVFLYVFDSILMLAVMIIFNVIHPGKILKNYTETWSLQELQK